MMMMTAASNDVRKAKALQCFRQCFSSCQAQRVTGVQENSASWLWVTSRPCCQQLFVWITAFIFGRRCRLIGSHVTPLSGKDQILSSLWDSGKKPCDLIKSVGGSRRRLCPNWRRTIGQERGGLGLLWRMVFQTSHGRSLDLRLCRVEVKPNVTEQNWITQISKQRL